jgi:hypothetical protein
MRDGATPRSQVFKPMELVALRRSLVELVALRRSLVELVALRRSLVELVALRRVVPRAAAQSLHSSGTTRSAAAQRPSGPMNYFDSTTAFGFLSINAM